MSSTSQLTIESAISKAKKAIKKGKITTAIKLYNAVLLQYPEHPVAIKNLHKLHKKTSILGQKKQNPTTEEINLIKSLYDKGYMHGTEIICRDLLTKYPKSFVILNFLGGALHGQRKTKEAILSFDKAIEIQPNFPAAHSNRGNILIEENRLTEARISYETAIKLKPDFTKAHLQLGTLKKYYPNDPHIGLMESLCNAPNTNTADQVNLRFSLAKAYDDICNYEKSFNHLSKANFLHKKNIGFSINKDIEVITYIKDVFSKKHSPTGFIKDTKPSPQTIFIVGMPRSGTSLVEQIISSHSKVYGAGELKDIQRLIIPIISPQLKKNYNSDNSSISQKDVSAIRSGYIESLSALNVRKSIITDKMPINFKWIGFILLAFPQAKIINVSRNPIATCWSIFKYHFLGLGNSFAYDLNDIAEYYKQYTDLMTLWRTLYQNNIYDICYEQLTENQEAETRKLLGFCNLDWEDACLNFHKTERIVKTISATQVRKKMYTGSSNSWKKYEEYLQPLITRLEE